MGHINPIIAKDGRELQIEWYDKTIKGADGAAERVLAIGVDVTERKKMEEEARKRLQELEVFYKASVGREERIIELKKEIESLRKGLK
jgi:PAS domain-containing protein